MRLHINIAHETKKKKHEYMDKLFIYIITMYIIDFQTTFW